MNTLRITTLLYLMTCGIAMPDTLNVSASGQFSSSVTATRLSQPSGTWALSFDVRSAPSVSNVDSFGFDTSFSDFSYSVNGSSAAETPESIRFSTTEGLGLFTTFFGPESGYDANGYPIPEFSFEGAQAFSGSTSKPTILSGDYWVASWSYSDFLNFDEHDSPGSGLTIAPMVSPEPASHYLVLIAVFPGLLAFWGSVRPSYKR